MKALTPKRLKTGDVVTWTDRKTKKERTLTIGKPAANLEKVHPLQLAHKQGEIDLYQPIEAYSQKWKTIFDKHGEYVSAHPVGEPTRNDLPPVYMQWKQDFNTRFIKD